MRRAWIAVTLAFVGSSVGCFGTSGTADESTDDGTLDAGPGDGAATSDSTPSDSTTGDTASGDTGMAPDTGTAPTDTGTAPTDTGTAPTDTGTAPADTGTTPTDTGTTPTDTGTTPTDTGVVDTGTDTSPVAELSCTLVSGPSSGTIDLASGTLDFAHWGLLAKESWDHKSGGTYLLNKGTVKGGYGQYAAYPISFAWTGGTPTATVTSTLPTATGVWVNKKDDGFDFDVVATPTGAVLVVWMARSGDTGLSVKVTPSDTTVATFSGDVPSTGSITPATLTCKFRGAATSSKLSVQIRQQANCGGCYGSLLSALVKSG